MVFGIFGLFRFYRLACVHRDGLWSPLLLQAKAGWDRDGLVREHAGLPRPRPEAGVETQLHELHPHRDGRDGQSQSFSNHDEKYSFLFIIAKVCYTDKCPDCGRQPPGSVKMRLHQDPDSTNMILHQENQDPGSIKIRTSKMVRSLAENKLLQNATSREEKENTQTFQTNYFVVWNFH